MSDIKETAKAYVRKRKPINDDTLKLYVIFIFIGVLLSSSPCYSSIEGKCLVCKDNFVSDSNSGNCSN